MNDLAVAVNNKRVLSALRDEEVLKINERYESDLSQWDEKINGHTDALRAWAESNPDQFPKSRKSIEMLSGTLGFRTGTPKLALLSRAFNWDKVLSLITANPIFAFAVRVKKEVDKEAILDSYGNSNSKADSAIDLQKVGLKVVQEESFFVEPKLTKVETRQTDAV